MYNVPDNTNTRLVWKYNNYIRKKKHKVERTGAQHNPHKTNARIEHPDQSALLHCLISPRCPHEESFAPCLSTRSTNKIMNRLCGCTG